jgi:hypothetical protein
LVSVLEGFSMVTSLPKGNAEGHKGNMSRILSGEKLIMCGQCLAHAQILG